MRLAIMKLAQNQLQEFINIAGIEMQGWLYFCFFFRKGHLKFQISKQKTKIIISKVFFFTYFLGVLFIIMKRS